MKKSTILTSIFLLSVFMSSHAQEKTLKEMQAISSRVIRHQMSRDVKPDMLQVGRRLSNVTVMKAPGKGFVVLSNRSGQVEVLGYSDTEYDESNQPCGFKCWLDRINQTMGEKISLPAPETAIDDLPDSVPPLLKTQWSQTEPYNRLCPNFTDDEGKEGRSVTGCVATAMAQMMYFYGLPGNHGEGEFSVVAKRDTEGNKDTLTMNIEDITLRWNKMLETYEYNWVYDRSQNEFARQNLYTDDEAQAVAELMLACGYASGMNYSDNSSRAFLGAWNLRPFGYSWGNYINASYMSDKKKRYLRRELSNGHPIFVRVAILDYIEDTDAYSVGDGHAMLIDGYNTEGLFHYNFGWGGHCDGYYQSFDRYSPTGGFTTEEYIVDIRPENHVWKELTLQNPAAGQLENIIKREDPALEGVGTLSISGDINRNDMSHIQENKWFLPWVWEREDDPLPSVYIMKLNLTDAHFADNEVPFYCFADAHIKEIILPDDTKSIGEMAFYENEELNEMNIPSKVTSVGIDAFNNCSSLKSLTIPSSVNSIGRDAFLNCPNLKYVFCLGRQPMPQSRIFRSEFDEENEVDIFSPETYENATLYVPAGTLMKYKTTLPWSKFKNIETFNPTGIEDIPLEERREDTGDATAIYDLTGRRLAAIPDKGLYIQGGKMRLSGNNK